MAKIDCRAVLRLEAEGLSRRRIAQSLGCSRDSVKRVLNRAKKRGITWEQVEPLSGQETEAQLFPERGRRGEHVEPDFEYVHAELAKPKVTLSLLHQEYVEQCEKECQTPYSYSQYCNRYRSYAKRKKATLRIEHKPADVLEVDWAGDVLTVHETDSGVTRKAYLFVACLPYSQLIYAEAFPDMKSESWITANVHALEYIGGIPAGIVPDNLKTGVTKHTRTETLIAQAYQEMAEYYNTVIVPARVRAPRDKASVERSVGICETWIAAKLRGQHFETLTELNKSIHGMVDDLNEQPFQKKEGSRRSVFEREEKPFLKPLPEIPFEVPVWKAVIVQPDYLVEAAGCRYSVPYEYIGSEVRIRLLRASVDIFYDTVLIASHIRRPPQTTPVYLPQHMPEKHRATLRYSEENCRQWAEVAGGSIAAVVHDLLSQDAPVMYRTKQCGILMRLADQYSLQRLEKACGAALSVGPNPAVKTIEKMLQEKREDVVVPRVPEPSTPAEKAARGLTRGIDYYTKGLN